MSTIAHPAAPPRRLGRSIAAVAIGFVSVAVVSLVTDQSLHVLKVTQYDLGPAWYPIALAASALPCAWLGGKLQR